MNMFSVLLYHFITVYIPGEQLRIYSRAPNTWVDTEKPCVLTYDTCMQLGRAGSEGRIS